MTINSLKKYLEDELLCAEKQEEELHGRMEAEIFSPDYIITNLLKEVNYRKEVIKEALRRIDEV